MYQKAYVEFFVSPDKLDALLSKLDQHPSITYMAVNMEGDVRSNMKQDTVNAVTWGVFPGALAGWVAGWLGGWLAGWLGMCLLGKVVGGWVAGWVGEWSCVCWGEGLGAWCGWVTGHVLTRWLQWSTAVGGWVHVQQVVVCGPGDGCALWGTLFGVSLGRPPLHSDGGLLLLLVQANLHSH